MKNYLDGGEAVLQAFRCLGVDYVMSSPGSEWGPVWEAFARQAVNKTNGPVYLSCAHETLAVDLAIGYTALTGRMQAVMLHTGVGLLQGAMGIDGAARAGVPMVVVSGEALTYGEKEGFDPGPQWQASLSVVGGTHRLAEPLVKWSTQASSPQTLFQQLINAGEMAQRAPAGPTYMAVPIETMLHEWSPPASVRMAPPAPKLAAAAADIEKVAELLVAAQNPLAITEAAGRDAEGYAALVALAELLAIPVVEGQWSDYTNFPKDHPLHQGVGQSDLVKEADVILTIRARAPWYPPRSRPAQATVVAIDETPFRPQMVYHNSQADHYLEGDVATTLSALAQAARDGLKKAAVEERRQRCSAAHARLMETQRAALAKAAPQRPISPLQVCASLGTALPDSAIYVDETITHRGTILRHLQNKGPKSYIHAQGGLGQGLGIALGVKLAAKTRPVVSLIGDGSFMYNPVVQSLALSHHRQLPILIVVFNNGGYSAMRREHWQYYPDGVAAAHDIYPGHGVTELDYSELVKPFGGYGRKVEDPAEIVPTLKEGLKATEKGRTAIVNIILEGGAP